jgi:glutamine amidotransferase
MTLAIIDYGSGNLRSVAKAFELVAQDTSTTVQVTSDPRILSSASHIVLPGVGAFADCMKGLADLPGMLDALEENVRGKGKKFLGICVGMQMLFDEGHEHGVHKGLGWLHGKVLPLAPRDKSLKLPHMGWNEINLSSDHPLLKGIETGDHAYFVHSYYAQVANPPDILALTDYGQTFASVVGRDNIMGTQFHPEKSQETGLLILKNFLAL